MTLFIGPFLRQYTKTEQLCSALLRMEVLKKLTIMIENPEFEIAADCFETLKQTLMSPECEEASIKFIENSPGEIIDLLTSLATEDENYFAKRKSLELLIELLQKPKLENLQKAYLCSKDKLKDVMQMLLDSEGGIAMEAFELLGLFILSPVEQPDEITNLFKRNKENLFEYLDKF